MSGGLFGVKFSRGNFSQGNVWDRMSRGVIWGGRLNPMQDYKFLHDIHVAVMIWTDAPTMFGI